MNRTLAWMMLGAALAIGCAQPAESPTTTGAGGGGTTTTAGSGGNGGGDFNPTTGSGGGGQFAECATDTAKAQLLPLDMYIMLDQSGSMLGARWTAVTSALKSFTEKPETADLGVALQFFPLPGQGVCDFNAYGAPEVKMAPLSANAGAITSALGSHVPSGETPTLPALQGALGYAKDWATKNPTHTVVVVLATDGEPNVCGSTVEKVAQAAGVGLATSPSIQTFVVGVGELTSLDDIAAAGGTGKAFLVDDANQSTEAQFIQALNDIRKSALPCEYAIPQPEMGSVDYDKVNIIYAPGEGAEQVLPYVSGPGACGASAGWYYDDPKNPTKVVLCATSCEAAKSDAKGRVDVVFGCVTVAA